MKKLFRFKFNVAFLFLIVMAGCSKNDTTPTPPGPATIASISTPNGLTSGPKNTVITITGTNFITNLAQIQVKVNGKNCTVLTATAISITAQIPPACGTGIVELFLNGTRYSGPVFTFIYSYTLTSITNGVNGYQDGPIANAQWEEISGLCVDTGNNIFTSAYAKPVVRKITSDLLTVSTLAGDRTVGDVNGQGTNAKLGYVDNISVDKNGDIYYADQFSNKVKKIDKLGNVTTFLTTATLGFFPMTAEVGSMGNVYVLGSLSAQTVIAKYNSSGVLQWKIMSHGIGSTDGDSSVVKLNNITFGNATIDGNETNLYFSTYSGISSWPSQIKKLNLSTLTTTTIAGVETVSGSNDGPAASATFKLVTGLAIDNQGGLYISDGYNDKLRFLKNGTVSTIIGAAGPGDVDGDLAVAKIKYPDGLRFDNKGNLIIACVTNNKIKKLVID
ncbi:MAG TPA: IPT/TIG domain-containing protein [Ferruginibacter sp.]|nr:IPT/TIG domain-containing protein [Ferruginibacter sp.]